MNKRNLPTWLEEKLRDPVPATAINGHDDVYSVIFPEGDISLEDKDFENFSEAYTYAVENVGENIVLQGNALKFHGTVKDESDESYEVYTSYTDQDRYNKIVNDFDDFQIIAQDYHAIPEDFMRAYSYIMHHPAFWLSKPTKDEKDGKTLNWRTNYSDRIVVYPVHDGADDIMWLVNAEAHLLDKIFGQEIEEVLWHQSSTIEEAYVKVAEKLAIVYSDDGTLNKTYEDYAENLSEEENAELEHEVEDLIHEAQD